MTFSLSMTYFRNLNCKFVKNVDNILNVTQCNNLTVYINPIIGILYILVSKFLMITPL